MRSFLSPSASFWRPLFPVPEGGEHVAVTHDRPGRPGQKQGRCRKPQRKRATKGSECERVSAAGFSLTLFMDQDGAASVTAKVNTAECRGRRCR
ncbi:hypothetical protein, partial [Shigella sonnei]|uniref:hypothetical protein n=1 Tax=Shigella sonnei TaxID=624 RepID=UPI001C0A82B4